MATSVDSLSIQISASTKSAKDRVDALCTSLNELVTAINALDVSKFDALSNATNSLAQGLAGIKSSGIRSVEKMSEAIDHVQSKSQAFDPIAKGAEKVTVATEEATKSTEQVVEVVDALHADPLDELANAAEKASASMEKSASKMSAFKSMLASLKIIVPTDGLVDVNKKIDKLQAKVADLKDKLAFNSRTNPDYIDSKEMEKDQQQIQGLINELERLKLKKQELESHGGFKFNDFGKGISNLHSKLSSVNKQLGAFTSRLFKAKSASRETTKASNEFKLSADRLVKSLTRVTKMLKLMVTRMALRAVIKEVGNGFKSLALHSEEFNASMSGLINSSKKLGYSFAAMVGPLVNALAPALIYLIELITKAINAINQLFSALSGKGTYNKAKNFSENWADNIQAANKSAKELKKTVLGFDELNQLQENKNSGGGGSDNIEDMFETVAIESKWADLANYIKNLAKKLFDPIKKAWDKVGDFVKKSWKYAMDEVLKLVKSVARDFWKVWEQEETQKIFENILKAIGWIGVAVGNLAKRFREAWDKNETGLHILENIRDIILIITNHVERMAKATADWADTLDFSPILTKFNEWLDSLKPVVDNLMGIVEDFYTTVILPLADWAIREGGPQLLQVFIDFNNKVDWEGLRTKLKKLWESLEPFAETVGEGLIIFIDRLAQALANFINSPEFEKFLNEIEEWMDSVTPQDVADGLEAIAKAIIGFAIGKAVIDGLVAISGFLKLIASLAPLLKLAVVITVAYGSLKLGGLLGKWLTGDEETYDHYTVPVMLEWVGGEIPKSWDDFTDKLKDWTQGWEDMLAEANAFIQVLARILEFAANPVFGTLLNLFRIGGGDTGMSFNGGAGADVDADEWQKTIEAAKEATQRAEEYKATKEKIPQMWSSSGGAGANVESSEWNTVIQAAKESTASVQNFSKEITSANASMAGMPSDVWNKLNASTKEISDSTKKFKDTLTPVAESTKALKNSADDVSSSYGNLKNSTGTLKQALDDANNAYKNVKTGMESNVSYAPTFTQAQTDLQNALKNTEKETENYAGVTSVSFETVDLAVANTTVAFDEGTHQWQTCVQDGAKEITEQTDKIKDSFDEKEWTFEGVGEGLTKTFEKAKNGIKNVWNSIADKLNGEYELGEGKFKVKLPRFASGGFPDEDGIFMANSSELVGRFSNGRTAVANNAQIVEGISAGVYNAVTSAMANSRGSGGGYIANTIVVDGEVIARTVTKAQERQNMRYSPQMV